MNIHQAIGAARLATLAPVLVCSCSDSAEVGPGVIVGHVAGRYGFALGDRSDGDLWLQNESGVTLHLKAKHEGLTPSPGGDVIAISMML